MKRERVHVHEQCPDIFSSGKKACEVCLLYFLENDADPNSKNKYGSTPLQFFLTYGQKKLRKAKKRYFDHSQNNFYKLLHIPNILVLRNV